MSTSFVLRETSGNPRLAFAGRRGVCSVRPSAPPFLPVPFVIFTMTMTIIIRRFCAAGVRFFVSVGFASRSIFFLRQGHRNKVDPSLFFPLSTVVGVVGLLALYQDIFLMDIVRELSDLDATGHPLTATETGKGYFFILPSTFRLFFIRCCLLFCLIAVASSSHRTQ